MEIRFCQRREQS